MIFRFQFLKKKINTVFVTPTIGNEFVINNSATQNYDALAIYNATGEFIEHIDLKETTIWDASKYADGIYFIVATEGSLKATQKIIVKKK